MKKYTVSGRVDRFPGNLGWYFIRVPKEMTQNMRGDRGLIPVHLTYKNTSWDSSLLPMGNGTHFIALPLKVRKPHAIDIGDTVKISFMLRS